MTSYRLGINTCFAVKRWPQPERWARLVRDELRQSVDYWRAGLAEHAGG